MAYLRTSSAANVGADKDSERRQRAAIELLPGRPVMSWWLHLICVPTEWSERLPVVQCAYSIVRSHSSDQLPSMGPPAPLSDRCSTRVISDVPILPATAGILRTVYGEGR